MAISPVINGVRLKNETELPQKQFKIECKTDIPSDSVNKVLDVSCFCGGADCKTEGGATARGTVIFNVIYVSGEGVLKKYECAQEFDEDLDEAAVGKTVFATVKIEKVSSDLSGTRLVLNAVVSISARAEDYKELSFLADGEDVIADREERTLIKGLGAKRANFPVEEEFETSYEIAEVLFQEAKASITEVQCGVGSVIADGEVVYSALMLQNTESGDIIKEEKTLPFRFELEYEEAMPSLLAVSTVSVKSLRSDVSVDEESKKSVVAVSAGLRLAGEVFGEERISVIKDAFCVDKDVSLSFDKGVYKKPCAQKVLKTNVVGVAGAAIPENSAIIAVKGENAEILSLKTGKTLKADGILSAKIIYKDGEGKIGTVNAETPFSIEKEADFYRADDIKITVTACSATARAVSPSETEIGASLTLGFYGEDGETFNFVSGITEAGEKAKNDAAISVYIPLEGEELFSLSKRLNVCPESLISTNRELQFPLSGKERIVVYRQK